VFFGNSLLHSCYLGTQFLSLTSNTPDNYSVEQENLLVILLRAVYFGTAQLGAEFC
jgi:hypothetical protein